MSYLRESIGNPRTNHLKSLVFTLNSLQQSRFWVSEWKSSCVLGFGVQGSGVRGSGGLRVSGFRVSGLRAQGLGCWGSGFGVFGASVSEQGGVVQMLKITSEERYSSCMIVAYSSPKPRLSLVTPLC